MNEATATIPAEGIHPGDSIHVTATVGELDMPLTRLAEVRERTSHTILGRTEVGEPILVELDSGRIALWLLGGWLFGQGTSGGTTLEARTQRKEREQRAAERAHWSEWPRL